MMTFSLSCYTLTHARNGWPRPGTGGGGGGNPGGSTIGLNGPYCAGGADGGTKAGSRPTNPIPESRLNGEIASCEYRQSTPNRHTPFWKNLHGADVTDGACSGIAAGIPVGGGFGAARTIPVGDPWDELATKN
eukprot:1180014-Prorocentrum_minimum.AAC.2